MILMLGMPLNRSTGHTMRTLSETEIGETVAYQSETLAHYRAVVYLLNRKPFRSV